MGLGLGLAYVPLSIIASHSGEVDAAKLAGARADCKSFSSKAESEAPLGGRGIPGG